MAPRGLFEFPEENFAATDAAIADGALGAVTAVGKEKCGFINLAIDISPRCDCVGFADMPIVPNLGVFASKDPVAIDMACLDKVRESTACLARLPMTSICWSRAHGSSRRSQRRSMA